MRRCSVVLCLIPIIVLLCGFTVGAAQAANTVPWLTGTFTGIPMGGGGVRYCSPYGDWPGDYAPTEAYIWFDPVGPSDTWSITSTQTSMTYSYDPSYGCSSSFQGTTDGPITATFGNLTFNGQVTGGAYGTWTSVSIDTAASGGWFTAPFAGFWSNGMYSTGTLGAEFWRSGYDGPGYAYLDITTVSPEPSTFVLIGAGLVPTVGAIRRRYLNR